MASLKTLNGKYILFTLKECIKTNFIQLELVDHNKMVVHLENF